MWIVWVKLVWLCEVDEGAYAGDQEVVQLLSRLLASDRGRIGAIGELAGHERWSCPVRVRDGPRWRARLFAHRQGIRDVFQEIP